MFRRFGLEKAPTFDEALKAEAQRTNEGWWFGQYRRAGLYAHHLERYLDAFGRERMALYIYEDLMADPKALCKDVFTFLDVDPEFRPDVSEARNSTTRLRSPSLRLAASASRGVVTRLPEPVKRRIVSMSARAPREAVRASMAPSTRRELCDFYADDVKSLSVLLDRDLSHWLRVD